MQWRLLCSSLTWDGQNSFILRHKFVIFNQENDRITGRLLWWISIWFWKIVKNSKNRRYFIKFNQKRQTWCGTTWSSSNALRTHRMGFTTIIRWPFTWMWEITNISLKMTTNSGKNSLYTFTCVAGIDLRPNSWCAEEELTYCFNLFICWPSRTGNK